MEGAWCNNVLTPEVDITLFGKQVRNAIKEDCSQTIVVSVSKYIKRSFKAHY